MTKRKILIVEDEIALSRVLALKLTASGFECEVASDGLTAYEKIKAGGFNLIILDLILPGLDGFEILEKTKELKERPKIVVLSNLNQVSDVKRVKDLGAIDFFVKSNIQLADIVSYVKKLLP